MAVYDEKKTEDIATFDGDDPLDDLRYFCKTVRRFINGEIGNLDQQIKINQVIQNYEQTQDMNILYRQMEVLEKGNNIINGLQQIRPRGVLARRRMRRVH
jgi:hypothetical protein